MKYYPETTICAARNGFSALQWIVAIAVVGLLGAVLVPVFGNLRENARRSKCADNLRQIGVALHHHADAHQGKLPTIGPGPHWPWDVTVEVTDALMGPGAVQLKHFYCPSGPFNERLTLWEHAVTQEGNRKLGVRVISYVLLLEGAADVLPQFTHSRLDGSGSASESAESSSVHSPASRRELAVDAVLSAGGGRQANFHSVVQGSAGRADRTNHLVGTAPAGGNILFLDGHVEWRPFDEMDETKVNDLPLFWW